MVKVFKQTIITVVLGLAIAFLVPCCATISSPQGGPRDSLPPRILSSDPAPYTVNFAGKYLTINFNEYIQLKDQQKIFFMSPAPKRKPSLTIKGRSLVVEFRDTLERNTTYRLDFGGSIVDNNEGNKLDGYTFTFSTGDYVDSLMMAGQVIDAFTQDTVIGAFINYFDAKLDSVALDSVLLNERAEAVFRTDSSGYFVADILKEKPYRIYAFQDNNGDQRYQSGADLAAFADTVFNPTELNAFAVEFDSTTNRTIIDDMQVRFELFKENARQRQNLISHKRVGRNKLDFAFAGSEARYDSLILNQINTAWLVEERNKKGDSITLWVAPPTKEQFVALPDSISGTFVYQRQDSVFQFFPKKEKLMFYNKTFVAPEDKKPKKDTLQEVEKVKNPFAFKVEAAQSLNPELGIGFVFDFPVRSIDSSRVKLTRIETNTKTRNKEVTKTEAPETFFFDSISMRHYILRAPWKQGVEYELLIPDSVFTDITFASNDTLSSKFTIANPDKFGTITLQAAIDTLDRNNYVVELIKGRGKNMQVLQRRRWVKAGDKVELRYIATGKYSIRVICDVNHNGEWDTGVLTERIKPEKVRVYKNSAGNELIEAKENWNIVEKFSFKDLFAK